MKAASNTTESPRIGSGAFRRLQAQRPGGAIFRLTGSPTLNILNGNRFMTTLRNGDIDGPEQGLYRDDTRFLSAFKARINEATFNPLTSNNTTHYSAIFYLTNPELDEQKEEEKDSKKRNSAIAKETVLVHRERFIEQDVREDFYVANVGNDTVNFTLSFDLAADFEDLFQVKMHAFGKKPDMPRGQEKGEQTDFASSSYRASEIQCSFSELRNMLDFKWRDPKTNFRAETLVSFSEKAKHTSVRRRNGDEAEEQQLQRIFYDLSLRPRESFQTTIVIVMLVGDEKAEGKLSPQYFQRQEEKIEDILRQWNMYVPELETDWDELRHSYYQGLLDLLFLRMPDPTAKQGWSLIAAGCPWFMTLFGRDTLITSYQSLLFGGDLAKGAIAALSEYQATEMDDNKDEQPGKIIHELRYGDYAARTGRFPYYGTADATPLYLILFSEAYRWTRDLEFANKYRPNVMAALNWIDRYGDFDHDGFVEYLKRSKEGLVNQSWKDSWNAIQFENGKIAEAPIATCEIQGYVYDAKLRIAEIAREAWKYNSLAKKLLGEANDLKELFNEKFWIEDKGYYALALDKDKKQVDSMTSNNGQLFWGGIVDQDKVDAVVEKLLDQNMFSGYGIRTLSTKDQGFDPIGYHTGCVWAHDNSIIAYGFARYGKRKEAFQVASGILDASPHFGYTLPEAFGGFPRNQTGFPIRYPTSCSPQAWAAGAPLLILRTLLGISPSQKNRKGIELKPILHQYEREKKNQRRVQVLNLELRGVSAYNERFNIIVRDGSKPEIEKLEKEKNEDSLKKRVK